MLLVLWCVVNSVVYFYCGDLFCFLLDWIWLLGAMIVLGSGYCVCFVCLVLIW